MIEFHYENVSFSIPDELRTTHWIESCAHKEGFQLGDLQYIFCNDDYLHGLNIEFLGHDTFTDIISFDYTMGALLSGDIFISVERVTHNSERFKRPFEEEMHRVMIHGILHYCGYKDHSEDEKKVMRQKENEYLKNRPLLDNLS